MKTVHLVMQGKGVVGKTFISSALAQYLIHATGKPVHCFDTDPVNKSFSQIPALNVQTINILTENKKIDGSQFDMLINQIIECEGVGVVDNGASSFVPLLSYLEENAVPQFLQDAGIRLLIHVPLQGGQALRDTMYGLSVILDALKTPIVIWLNNHNGQIEKQVDSFKDRALYKQHKNNIVGIVDIPDRSQDTFGKDIRSMTEQNLTFDEVAQSDKFFIMNKQRILIFKRSIFEQLDAINLGEKNDVPAEKNKQA